MSFTFDQHYKIKDILKIVLAPILGLIVTSIYGVIDGMFVANFAGKFAFDGLNLIFPVTLAISGIGYMLASGGSALVSKTLGEGEDEKANRYFTMLFYFTLIIGVIFSIVGYFIVEPCAYALAGFGSDSSQEMIDNAIVYGRITMIGQASLMVQCFFNDFFIVDGKRKVGLAITVSAGIINIILDAIFICGLSWGVFGAAVATIIAQCFGGVVPIIYFLKSKSGLINFVKTKMEFRPILQSCFNGSSEFISNISAALMGLLFNIQCLRYAGEDGLTAYGTIMYVTFIFLAICIGFNIGITPLIAFHYGANNYKELKSLKNKCFLIEIIGGILMCALGEALAYPMCYLYFSSNPTLLAETVYGTRLYMTSFIFTGVAIFIPTFFTSLNDGWVSGITSVFRTFFFQILTILVMPLIFGMTGLWLSITLSEFLASAFGLTFVYFKRKKYHY